MLAVRLMGRIERVFGRRLSLAVLFQTATIEHLARLLRRQGGAASSGPLVAIQPHGSRPALFCVHPAGGNVLCYGELARHLGPDQPFYGLQAKGLDGEAEPRTEIEAMASDYIAAVRSVQPTGPFLLGGWSMGGLVAFEMARQLHAQGERMALLALIDSMIPEPDEAAAGPEEASLILSLGLHLGLSVDQFHLSWEEFRGLGPEEQLAEVWEQAKLANRVPADVELSQVRLLWQVFKTNFQAMRSYTPRAYPGRITLFKAGQTLGKAAPEPPAGWARWVAKAGKVFGQATPEATLGWSRWAVGGVEVHVIPGDHHTMLREPNLPVLVERLQAALHQARANTVGSQL
jgi:thioesterase domain-containing protein